MREMHVFVTSTEHVSNSMKMRGRFTIFEEIHRAEILGSSSSYSNVESVGLKVTCRVVGVKA